MVLIFDLDDTLYDETSYVKSGLRAVARFGEISFGWNLEESVAFMEAQLLLRGRGAIFDEWLRSHDYHSATRVSKCIKIYRHHQPSLSLFPSAARVLARYKGFLPIYLVTDGHKIVQQKKIEALGIDCMFKRTFITHRFGIRHAKPSLYCFDLIRCAEQSEWNRLVYVGDNPVKDFVSLNATGAKTVRVKTGSNASALARPGYDAIETIPDLSSLTTVLDRWM